MSADQDKIKDMAYRLWQDAGSPDGRDHEFWYAAETAVKAAKPKAASKPKAAPKVKADGKAPAPKAAKPKTAPKAKTTAKV